MKRLTVAAVGIALVVAVAVGGGNSTADRSRLARSLDNPSIVK